MEDQQKKQLAKYMKVIDKNYILYSTHIIGKGSFGKVVYGKTSEDKDICFKFEKSNNKNSILNEEIRIYKVLKGGFGIPHIYSSGTFKNSNYLIMDLIGPSLDKYFILCEKKFKLDTVLYLGLQMIDRLEHVHDRGLVHRDIKPNNFLFGRFNRELNNEDYTVYIIDFGLSTFYLEANPDYYSAIQLINYQIGVEFKGNSSMSMTNSQGNPMYHSENISNYIFQSKFGGNYLKIPINSTVFSMFRRNNLGNIVNISTIGSYHQGIYSNNLGQYDNISNILNAPNDFHIFSNSNSQKPHNSFQFIKDITSKLCSNLNLYFNPDTQSYEIPEKKHFDYKDNAKFVGTPRYASLNTHIGIRQSRRDDLESIGYILAYFLLGDLPWQGVKAKTKSEKKEKIKDLKQSLNVDEELMFKDLYIEVKDFIKYTRGLSFYDRPDYDYLRGILRSLQEKTGLKPIPDIFEWEDRFTEEPYSAMKKKFKDLYEGYPTIGFSSYIDYIEQKKSKIRKGNFIQKTEASEMSLFDTTTNSELLKKKMTKKENLNGNEEKERENLSKLKVKNMKNSRMNCQINQFNQEHQLMNNTTNHNLEITNPNTKSTNIFRINLDFNNLNHQNNNQILNIFKADKKKVFESQKESLFLNQKKEKEKEKPNLKFKIELNKADLKERND